MKSWRNSRSGDLWSSQEIVHSPLVFGLGTLEPVVSRNRRERGKPHASSVVTQQEVCGVVCQLCSELLERRVLRDVNPLSSRHGDFHRRKRRYELAKMVAKVLDSVGYDDCSGWFQRCGRASQVPR